MTPNEIIGSLVYRTNNAMNGNQKFLDAVREYYYRDAIVNDGKLHLWHFPGTNQEISQVFQSLSKDSMFGGKLKFPGLLNFQSVLVEHQSDGITLMRFNLAVIAPVLSAWITQQRERQAYKLVLKPIEDEFIRQVRTFRYFQKPVGAFPYISLYVPTTGKSLNSIMKIQYGDFIDAIEFPNFSIKVMQSCNSMSEIIVNESKRVTDEIKNLIN